MKQLLLMSAILVLSNTNAFASYECTATLVNMQDGSRQEAPAKYVRNNVDLKAKSATISSFEYSAVETQKGVLALSVLDSAEGANAAYTTTLTPKKGQPAYLQLKVENEAAIILCTAL